MVTLYMYFNTVLFTLHLHISNECIKTTPYSWACSLLHGICVCMALPTPRPPWKPLSLILSGHLACSTTLFPPKTSWRLSHRAISCKPPSELPVAPACPPPRAAGSGEVSCGPHPESWRRIQMLNRKIQLSSNLSFQLNFDCTIEWCPTMLAKLNGTDSNSWNHPLLVWPSCALQRRQPANSNSQTRHVEKQPDLFCYWTLPIENCNWAIELRSCCRRRARSFDTFRSCTSVPLVLASSPCVLFSAFRRRFLGRRTVFYPEFQP